jgi:hypothetical protein
MRGGVFGLVTGPVFKTGERQYLSLAGSIPVRLRHLVPEVPVAIRRWRTVWIPVRLRQTAS